MTQSIDNTMPLNATLQASKMTKSSEMDLRIHEAAENFISIFMTQSVEEMLKASDMSDDSSPEKEFYSSFLAQGLGKQLAKSKASQHIVEHVENMMRRQAGLEDLNPSNFQHTPVYAAAHVAYGDTRRLGQINPGAAVA